MSKQISLKQSIFSLVKDYPESKDILFNLGFTEITNKVALSTVAKMMTLEKASDIKNVPLDKIKQSFNDHGFTFKEDNENTVSDLTDNEQLLLNYIERLSQGEDLESVRKEFKENFENVSATEITKAEQKLIEQGTKVKDVQRLCDIHSALFHGSTESEGLSLFEQYKQSTISKEGEPSENTSAIKAREYMNEKGHPLNILDLENKALLNLVNEIEANKDTDILNLLKKLYTIAQHYGKKDELMFPLLKDKYGFSGPSDVMWGVEDEIRASIQKLILNYDKYKETLLDVLKRIREMVYKEENILFPLCVSNFTLDEWKDIRRDMDMYGAFLIEELPLWNQDLTVKHDLSYEKDTIKLPGGTIRLDQLRAMLNTLPMELTLIDENDINQFFDEDTPKLFKRPTMAIGRSVYSCHPLRVKPMVKMLITDFKNGDRDSFSVMTKKQGILCLVNYYALRNENNEYLGTMEAVMKIDKLQDYLLKGKKGPVEW